MVTGMRNRIVTDTRIETFAPTTFGKMGGVVSKFPVENGAYEIRLRLECYGHTDCTGLRVSGTNLFNSMIAPLPKN